MFKTNVMGVTYYGATVFYKDLERKNVIIDFVNASQETIVKERFRGDYKLLSRFKKRISGKGITLEPRVMKHIKKAIERFYELINKGKSSKYNFDGENFLMPEEDYIFDSKKIFSIIEKNNVIKMSAGLDPEDPSIVNVKLDIKSNGRIKSFVSYIELDRFENLNEEDFTHMLKTHFEDLEKDAGLEHTGRFAYLMETSERGFRESLKRKFELFCELFKYSKLINRVLIRRAYEKIPNGHYSDDLFFTMKVFLEDGSTEEMLVTFKKENGPALLGDMYSNHTFRRCFVNDIPKDTYSNREFMKAYSYSIGDTEIDSDDTFFVNNSSLNFVSYKEDCSEGLVGYNINRMLRKDLSKVEDHSIIVNRILKNTYGHIYLNEDFDFNDIFKEYMNNSIKRFAERFTEDSKNPLNGEDLLYESSSDLLEADLLNVLELSINSVDPGLLNQSLTNKTDIREAFKYFPEKIKLLVNNAAIVRTKLLTDGNPDYCPRSIFNKEDYTRLYKYTLLVEILNNNGKKYDICITFENFIYPLIKEIKLNNYVTGKILRMDVRGCQRTLLNDSLLINEYLRNLLVYRYKIIKLLVLNKFASKVVLYKKNGLLHMDRALITNYKEVDEEIKNILNN